MKIVNLFTICILLSEMLLQVLTIRVNFPICSSIEDQKKCIENQCLWITDTKTCQMEPKNVIEGINPDKRKQQTLREATKIPKKTG